MKCMKDCTVLFGSLRAFNHNATRSAHLLNAADLRTAASSRSQSSSPGFDGCFVHDYFGDFEGTNHCLNCQSDCRDFVSYDCDRFLSQDHPFVFIDTSYYSDGFKTAEDTDTRDCGCSSMHYPSHGLVAAEEVEDRPRNSTTHVAPIATNLRPDPFSSSYLQLCFLTYFNSITID